MSSDQIRRQMGMNAGPQNSADDDGGLPWLEPAPDPDRGSLSFKSLAIIGTIFLLVFIALMAVFYNRIAGTGPDGGGLSGGSPTLIAAPMGNYKITPEQDARAELDYGKDDAAGASAPRFSAGSERPLSGAEQLEQVARSGTGGSVVLGSSDKPIVGYVRPATAPSEPAQASDEASDVSDAVKSAQAAGASISAPKSTPSASAPTLPPAPEPVAPTPTRAADTAAASTPTGFLLQLGAFSTRDSAMNGWNVFSQKYPGSLSGLSPNVQSFENASGKTLYRLRAAGLSSRSRADARCAALKAANQACFVVAP